MYYSYYLKTNTIICLASSRYRAFGMVMPERAYNAGKYRWGYNGKENDNETRWQDYGFRMYYPGLGKFLSVDPLVQKYPSISPYAAFANNPVMFVDKDGREVFAFDPPSRELVLKTINYMLGKNNSYSFDGNKLIHNNVVPSELSNEQKILFNYFNEVLVKSQTPTNVYVNQDNAAYLDNTGRVQQTGKVADGGGQTVGLFGGKRTENPGELIKGEDPKNIVLITSGLNQNGINVVTSSFEGVENKPNTHGLAHEFGHSIMNVIMNEMGGQFNGIDYNKMSKEQRDDWAIRFTNTILQDKNQSLETGAGQHNRPSDSAPNPTNIKPLSK